MLPLSAGHRLQVAIGSVLQPFVQSVCTRQRWLRHSLPHVTVLLWPGQYSLTDPAFPTEEQDGKSVHLPLAGNDASYAVLHGLLLPDAGEYLLPSSRSSDVS